jgi:hypothetical protein
MSETLTEKELKIEALVREQVKLFRELDDAEALIYCIDDVVQMSDDGPLIGESMGVVDRMFGRYAAEVARHPVYYVNGTLWGIWPNGPGDHMKYFDTMPEFTGDILIEWSYLYRPDAARKKLIIFHCMNEEDAVLLKLSLKPEEP